jgi:hypothetical protein
MLREMVHCVKLSKSILVLLEGSVVMRNNAMRVENNSKSEELSIIDGRGSCEFY